MTDASPVTDAARAKASTVHTILLHVYGHPDWRPDFPPVDELILTILSANTSDVNSGRAFQRLKGAYADWQAVLELTENLRAYDPADPVKYDFALFGLGVLERKLLLPV